MTFIPSEEVQEQILAQSLKNKIQSTDWKFEAIQKGPWYDENYKEICI